MRRILRIGLSVISKDTQHFIAEATKTLDLVDNQHCDEEGDALWMGCGSVEKSGRLCEVRIPRRLLITFCYHLPVKAQH